MTYEQITNRIKDLTVVAELGSDFSNQAKFYSYELINNPLFMTVLMAFHKEYECPVRGYGVRLSSTTKASGLVEIAAIRSGDIMAKASVKLPKTESRKQIRVQLTDVIPLDESSLWFLVQDFAITAIMCYLSFTGVFRNGAMMRARPISGRGVRVARRRVAGSGSSRRR